jgi:hypothetical protein
MVDKDDRSAGSRLSVNITPATQAALDRIVEREGVTVTEALRRLVGYGELVYRTIRVDGAEVLTRYGRNQQQVKLLDQSAAGKVDDLASVDTLSDNERLAAGTTFLAYQLTMVAQEIQRGAFDRADRLELADTLHDMAVHLRGPEDEPVQRRRS